MSASKSAGRWRNDLFAASVFLLVGVVFYQLKANAYFTAVPGDLIDARFNSVVLEHVYLWLTGATPDVWSPGFFYPVANVLALSDNHFGSILPYAAFRWWGLDRSEALSAWLMLGGVLNYACAYVAARSLGLRPSGAGAAAFVFAFSLPVLAQQAHAQFAFRMFVPLLFLTFSRWLQHGRPSSLAWSSLLFAAQVYCAIYTGVFAAYLLLAMTAAWLLLGRGRTLAAQVRASFGRNELGRTLASLAVVLASAIAVLALLRSYHAVTEVQGFVRPRDEILGMLPRVWSYLIADFSPLTRFIGGSIGDISMRHEHQLFLGLGVLLFAVVGLLVALRRIADAELGMLAGLATLVLVICTLNVSNVSLYRVFLHLPGIDSIRAVTRVMLVMVMPIGLLAGIGFQRVLLLASRRGTWTGALACVVAFVLLTAESVTFQAGHATFAQWQQRQVAFAARVPASARQGDVLFADRSAEAPYLDDLDAMIYAQDHGMFSVNGYSGYVPKGAGVSGPCESPEGFARAFGAVNGLAAPAIETLSHRLVLVPLGDCSGGRMSRMSGRVASGVAEHLRLDITGTTIQPGQVAFTLTLANGSDGVLSTREVLGRDVLLSWRFIPDGRDERAVDWDARQALVLELAPGDQAELHVKAPVASGSYTLEASLVQETMFWFHDEGMRIPSVHVEVP